MYSDVSMVILSLVHVTMVGGPLEELNERVKTGGSASREDIRVQTAYQYQHQDHLHSSIIVTV